MAVASAVARNPSPARTTSAASLALANAGAESTVTVTSPRGTREPVPFPRLGWPGLYFIY